jgi:methylated-DNA-[protein]-cysteine S-methyltransferase
MSTVIHCDELETPVGPVRVLALGETMIGLWFDNEEQAIERSLKHRFGADHTLSPARDPNGFTARVSAYFAGDLRAVEPIPCDGGGTPFQRLVWAELRRIPAGTAISYGELARRIGRPNATRAVGLANGQNPISIVVPCHRVIGSNGTLTGYGGGIERKRWLLEHEGVSFRDGVRETQPDLFRAA